MVNLVNSWMKGIIVAVIITIVIEMILPEGKNKKYIKTVINLYILYVIIAPVCTKLLHKNINFKEIMAHYQVPEISVKKIDNNKYIKEIYEQNIKDKITEDLNNMGFAVSEIRVMMSENDEDYGNIEKIELHVKKNQNKSIKPIEKINIGDNVKEENKIISEDDRNKITEYLISNYGISNENIIIGG